MKSMSLKSHKKCSLVKISSLNNFCSIHCSALKFGTHEEVVEPLLLTNFSNKTCYKSKFCVMYSVLTCKCNLLVVFFAVLVFLLTFMDFHNFFQYFTSSST